MPRGGIRIGAGRPKGQGKFGEKTKPIRIPLRMVDNVLSFIKNNDLSLPIYSNKVTAGCYLVTINRQREIIIFYKAKYIIYHAQWYSYGFCFFTKLSLTLWSTSTDTYSASWHKILLLKLYIYQ